LLGTAEAAERLLERLGASETAALGLHLLTGHEPLEQVELALVAPDEELTTDELAARRAGDLMVGVEHERSTRLVATRAVWAPVVESHRRRFGELRTRLGQPLGRAALASVLQHPRLAPSLKHLCAAALPKGDEVALDLSRHAHVRDFSRAAALLRDG
jgi:hypothetical protein